jgi:hypothetical protein
MFFTLSQLPTLIVLALASLGACQAEDSFYVDDFSPSIPASQQDGALGDVLKSTKALGRNATIRLFPASSLAFRPMMSMGCREVIFNDISLSTETCLSGDYYLNHNMLIMKPPMCNDGTAPTMSFYRSRGCGGNPDLSSFNLRKGKNDIPDYCLWGGHSSKYWSMIFRCNDDAAVLGGSFRSAKSFQVAVPPPAPHPESATDGVLASHLHIDCEAPLTGEDKLVTAPVDTCLTTSGLAITWKTPAVCNNGTRALWAKFEDDKCTKWVKTNGLVDIPDKIIGECTQTAMEERMESMAFWCEGFDSASTNLITLDDKHEKGTEPEDREKPKAAPGSVSESACLSNKAPFFNHPKTDTCVSLKTSKLQIFAVGICADGEPARLALFENKSCGGEPQELVEVSEDDLKRCLDLTGTSSFAFYCTGKGLGVPPEIGPSPPRQSGSLFSFILILLLMCLFAFLMLALSVWAWFRTGVGRAVTELVRVSNCSVPRTPVADRLANDILQTFLKRDQGAIAL